jgi:hypothetical protein
VWRLLRLIKIIEQRLRVFGFEVDHPRDRTFEMRVVDIETLSDELRMIVLAIGPPTTGTALSPALTIAST